MYSYLLKKDSCTSKPDAQIMMIHLSKYSTIMLWIRGWFHVLILMEIGYLNSVDMYLSLITIKCMFLLNDWVNYFSKSSYEENFKCVRIVIEKLMNILFPKLITSQLHCLYLWNLIILFGDTDWVTKQWNANNFWKG